MKDSKFENTNIISMFPTFVWQTLIKEEIYTAINVDIIKKLDELTGPDTKANFSWQSQANLHNLKEFKELILCVNDMTKNILQFLKINYDGFEITGCWANINSKGKAHKMHAHPNNFLSGVYYVQTDDQSNTINFHDPRIQMAIIRPPVSELTSENTDQVVVRVKNGMFLLFPSWLQHSVDASSSDKKRISISFNIMFSAFVKSMSKPLW